jgi:hypothetical protein
MYSTAQVFTTVVKDKTGTQKNQDADGMAKEITVSKQKFVAKAASEYIEPNLGLDVLDGMELIFKDCGKSVRQYTIDLPARNDIIKFDPKVHGAELQRNIRFGDIPDGLQTQVIELVKEFWDCFCEEGLRRHIRGFLFQVETSNIALVCCRVPRYGSHETKIMLKMVEAMEDNDLIEDNFGPWGANMVLAAKQQRDKVPWWDYVWRLCIKY